MSVKLSMARDELAKWTFYAAKGKGEVSGIGILTLRPDGSGVIGPTVLVAGGSAARTEMDSEDLMRALVSLERHEGPGARACVWLHTHPRMGAFWSGTDSTTILNTARTEGLCCAIVVNDKGDYKARLAYTAPVLGVSQLVDHDSISLELTDSVDTAAWQADLDRLPAPPVVTYSGGYSPRSYADYNGGYWGVNSLDDKWERGWPKALASEMGDDTGPAYGPMDEVAAVVDAVYDNGPALYNRASEALADIKGMRWDRREKREAVKTIKEFCQKQGVNL